MPGGFVRVGPPSASLLTPQPRPDFRVLPVVASVVPGLLLHGLGPLAAGDTRTAGRLFAMEGTGLGLLIISGRPIFLTGASRRVVGPLYAVALAGGGPVLAVRAGEPLLHGVSRVHAGSGRAASLPPLELDFGYQHVSDPNFDYRHFLALGATARLYVGAAGGLRAAVSGRGQHAGAAGRSVPGAGRAGGRTGRRRMARRWMWRPRPIYHRFPTEGFFTGSAEVGVRGRYAMARMSPRLRGLVRRGERGPGLPGLPLLRPGVRGRAAPAAALHLRLRRVPGARGAAARARRCSITTTARTTTPEA